MFIVMLKYVEYLSCLKKREKNIKRDQKRKEKKREESEEDGGCY